QAIYQEEMARAGAPGILGRLGVTLLAPTLLAHGTDWQKDTYIEKILSGELIFCQGFSEPDAGSDLAGLRTRAERRDGKWVLSGQKTWSSGAHYSDKSFLLARTDASARRGGHAAGARADAPPARRRRRRAQTPPRRPTAAGGGATGTSLRGRGGARRGRTGASGGGGRAGAAPRGHAARSNWADEK